MIALQANGGRVADPARITAQYANMLTAKRQAEAAQSQRALAQQQMEFARAGETRAQETQLTAQQKAKFEYTKNLFAEYTNRLAKIGSTDKTRYSNLRQQIIRDIPELENELPTADEWNDNSKFLVLADAEKFLRYKYATPVASTAINDRTGQLTSITAGGPDPRAEVIGEVAPQTATPTAAAPAMPSAEAPTAAPESNPFAPDAPPANTAAENVNSLGLVVASARETGVISQKDVSKLLSVAAPGSAPKLMGWLKQNNIQVVPNTPGVTDNQMRGAPAELPNEMTTTPMAYDGQTPQSQYADLRGPAPQSQTAGLRGAPPMEQTMLQSQGRTPFIPRRESPAPGVYQVPTQDVAATSRATRPSKQEQYDAEAAKIQAARDAGPAPVTAQQKIARKSEVAQAYSKAQTLIDKAYNPKEGIISIANKIKMLSDDQKEAITGYSNYIPSFRGTTREADTLFGNLKGVVTSLGKDAAAASGAVGNMAVQEWKIAADMIANLDLANMTPRALDAQMDRIIEQVSNATKLAERVYNIQYGDDVKELPTFKLRGTPPTRTKTPVAKGGTMISPDIDKILKSRGI
jgi:hypothetical protein